MSGIKRSYGMSSCESSMQYVYLIPWPQDVEQYVQDFHSETSQSCRQQGP